MKKQIGAVVLALTMATGAAFADAPDAEHNSIGLGFHSLAIPTLNSSELRVNAPIGVRWWLSGQKIGVDLGVGFRSDHATPDETLSSWAVDVGVPIVLHSWDRVHFLFRPGLNYASQEEILSLTPTVEKDSDTFMTISAELEAEVFLADNVSVSASHGIGFVSYNPAEEDEESTTDFGTFGTNFTSLGFHIYLWGGH